MEGCWKQTFSHLEWPTRNAIAIAATFRMPVRRSGFYFRHPRFERYQAGGLSVCGFTCDVVSALSDLVDS